MLEKKEKKEKKKKKEKEEEEEEEEEEEKEEEEEEKKHRFGDFSKIQFLTKKSDGLNRFLVKFLKMYIFIYLTVLVVK